MARPIFSSSLIMHSRQFLNESGMSPNAESNLISSKGRKQKKGRIDISVRTPDWNVLTWQGNKTTTIAEVKVEIAKPSFRSVDRMRLMFELPDDRMLQNGIQAGDELRLETRELINVQAENGETTSYDPHAWEAFAGLRQRKHIACSYDPKGGWVDDDYIFVKMPNGDMITLEVHELYTIAFVKEMIADRLGVHIDSQRLMFELKDDRKLEQGILYGDMLRMEMRPQIFIKMLKGDLVSVDVQLLDTIDQLKEKVRSAFKLTPQWPHSPRYKFAGTELERFRSLSSYKIKYGDVIDVSWDVELDWISSSSSSSSSSSPQPPPTKRARTRAEVAGAT